MRLARQLAKDRGEALPSDNGRALLESDAESDAAYARQGDKKWQQTDRKSLDGNDRPVVGNQKVAGTGVEPVCPVMGAGF